MLIQVVAIFLGFAGVKLFIAANMAEKILIFISLVAPIVFIGVGLGSLF
jgi:hypothetical protein